MASIRFRQVAIGLLLGALSAPAQSHAQPQGPASLPSIAQIVDRHRHAIGRLPSTSARWSGSIVQDGNRAHFEIVADRDGRYRQTVSYPLATRSEGSDPDVHWEQDENGDVETSKPTDRFPMSARLVQLNQYVLGLDDRASVSEQVTIGGKAAYPVHTTFAGSAITVYIDATSWLVDGADFKDATVRYREYRRFAGVPVPAIIEERRPNSVITTTIEQIAWGASARAAAAVPPQRIPDFPAGRRQVSLRFSSPRGLIVMRATLDGQPIKVLLDSASSGSLIDAAAAARLKLETAGTARVEGASLLLGSVARAESLNVGGLVFRHFVMDAIPLRLPPSISGEGIEAVLGYDAFASLVVRVDYSKEQITFIAPDSFTYAGNGAIESIDVSDHVPKVAASLGNQDRGRFTIDTGSGDNLVLFEPFFESHANDFDRSSQRQDFDSKFVSSDERYHPADLKGGDSLPQTASGAGGELPVQQANVRSFSLGGISLTEVPAQIILRPAGAFSPLHSDGLIGGKTLASFRAVFFDYSRKRFIVEP